MPHFEETRLERYLSQIFDALVHGDRAALRRFGQKNGFVNDHIRRLVWPCLLQCEDSGYTLYTNEKLGFPDLDERDKTTIQQDVRRSFTRFPVDLDDVERKKLEEKLERSLQLVLRIHPRLHYVQGLHDLAEITLLVTDDDENLCCKLLHRLSLSNFRDMLLPSLEPTLSSLDIIPGILQRVDIALYKRVVIAIRPPHFAASAVMTWFAHEIDSVDRISTIFDFLISSEPVMIFYLAAAVPSLKSPVLTAEDEDEDDFATVYSRLTGVFRSNAPFTIVFPLALKFFQKVPPESLEAYRSLSELSCYKTGTDVGSDWLERGMQLLKQATEEQYRVRKAETNTETIRREVTVTRQQIADAAMERYARTNDQVQISDEELRTRIDTAKAEAIRAEKVKWEKIQKERAEMEIREKENLLLGSSKEYFDAEDVNGSEIGVNYWGVIIGGTAVAGIAIAIAKGYRYL